MGSQNSLCSSTTVCPGLLLLPILPSLPRLLNSFRSFLGVSIYWPALRVYRWCSCWILVAQFFPALQRALPPRNHLQRQVGCSPTSYSIWNFPCSLWLARFWKCLVHSTTLFPLHFSPWDSCVFSFSPVSFGVLQSSQHTSKNHFWTRLKVFPTDRPGPLTSV